MGPLIGRGLGIWLARVAAVGGIALVQRGQATADGFKGLDHLALELDQDVGSVGVRALLDLCRLALRLLDDLLRSLLRGTRELALLDEEGGLLLGARDDALEGARLLLQDNRSVIPGIMFIRDFRSPILRI